MKYIFLDIDGVLNASGDKNLIDGIIDEYKFNLLKLIIKYTNAYVVIISSRRIYLEDRNSLLRALDDIYDRISFISYQINYKYRKDEINEYLKTHPCSSFVILDDIDSKYSTDEFINKHFICISTSIGLTVENVKEAIKILNE